MAEVLGLNAKLYYSVGGQDVAAWVELTNAKDVTLNLDKAEADVTTRASGGYRQRKGTLKDASIEFEMVWDDADAGFTAIRNSYLNNALIGIQCLDGAGGQGLQADFEVMSFTRNEPLENALTVSVSLMITRSDTAPSWIGA